MNHHSNIAAMSTATDMTYFPQDARCYLSSSMPVLRQYLTLEEEKQIIEQFRQLWRPNAQVLWNGIPREKAQKWADEHHMQTLTTVMGLLMDKKNPLCPNHNKTKSSWTKYIEGASAVYAWSISRGRTVVVLSPPPPERFNPIGLTNFQMIEAPILHWAAALSHTSLQIYSVHPMVKGAEDFRYQIWPVDDTKNWDTHFKNVKFQQREWRVPIWDKWKILIRDTLESMVGSGFWIESELFGLSKWKQASACMEERKRKKSEYKIKEEAEKIEKSKILGQKEKKKKKKPKKAKTSRNIMEGQQSCKEQKKCPKKKKKRKKKRRKVGMKR
jgi:hypothetical protein